MKKNLAKIGTTVATAATFLASVYPVLAAVDIPAINEVPKVTVTGILQTAIRLIIIVAFIISFVILLIGGIRWMTAGGDPKNVEGARNMVTGGLIGLVIVLAAFAIIRLIEFLFGVTIISQRLPVPNIPIVPAPGPLP